MSLIHFLNVLEGDCNIIQHDSGRVTVIDVSNASNMQETESERAVRTSAKRREMLERTQVPGDKIDYRQKLQPDNPITYISNHLKINDIFRLVISHPDMDHIDGIRDFFQTFKVWNVWDTDNNKEIKEFGGGYNKEDWDYYLTIRNGKHENRKTFYSGQKLDFFQHDNIQILAPTAGLVSLANKTGDFNDASYVLLYTPPKIGGGNWKILFAGDSHDDTWEHILNTHKELVTGIDVLFAPHHGRDSDRDYAFLKVIKPRLTLFGNASSKHLAYGCYPETRITNNQAGYIILDISSERIKILVKNKEFCDYFRNNSKKGRKWGASRYNQALHAFELGELK